MNHYVSIDIWKTITQFVQEHDTLIQYCLYLSIPLLGIIIFVSEGIKSIKKGEKPTLPPTLPQDDQPQIPLPLVPPYAVRLETIIKSALIAKELDYVGAKSILELISIMATRLDDTIHNKNFNRLVCYNSTIDQTQKMLDDKIAALEKAMQILTLAISKQEIGGASEVDKAVEDAKSILESQCRDDMALAPLFNYQPEEQVIIQQNKEQTMRVQ